MGFNSGFKGLNQAPRVKKSVVLPRHQTSRSKHVIIRAWFFVSDVRRGAKIAERSSMGQPTWCGGRVPAFCTNASQLNPKCGGALFIRNVATRLPDAEALGTEFNVYGSVHRKYIPLRLYPTRCNVTQFIIYGKCSTCFGWYLHPTAVPAPPR